MVRIERDSLGEVEVPDERYFGAQTMRSMQNFAIGYHRMPKELIEAFLLVKKACTKVNLKLELLGEEQAKLILGAIEKVFGSDFKKDFPLSVWQTGSGTQTNMNVNTPMTTSTCHSLLMIPFLQRCMSLR